MRKEPDASREENKDVRAVKERPATRAAKGEIAIDAPVEVVWKALTDARELERWFPLEARVKPG
ncbi:MAG TPA: SRPBCC domain-containing protein, partial [Gemmatimonadota bacterium]|nr:SRPBCC domain-containing protein [Gemmatimonadota bacterium]